VIPKVLHLVWLGVEARRPDRLTATWLQHNPDWTVKIWDRSDLDTYPWRNRTRILELAQCDADGAAALMRWEILLDEGGLVFDADGSCVRPLEASILDCDAFACWEDEFQQPARLCADHVGALPGNAFFEQLVESLGDGSAAGAAPIDEVAGSGFLTRMWRRERYAGLTVYPSRFFSLRAPIAASDPRRRQIFAVRGGDGAAAGSGDGILQQARPDRLPAPAARGAAAAPRPKQLLVDISELIRSDARTGIQRVTRGVLRALLQRPPSGLRPVAVYADATRPGYRRADQFLKAFASGQGPLFDSEGRPMFLEDDLPAEFGPGDVFLGLDLQMRVVPAQAKWLQRMRRFGVKVAFVVYDLLPVRMPHCFPAGSEQSFRSWLETVARCDAAICISRAVADELAQWAREHVPERLGSLQIDWFHIGADIGASIPSRGMPADASGVIEAISKHPSFLLVGTLEPRKGHAQTLDAFERLWAQGTDARLVIVGKRGWLVDGFCDRLRAHPEAGKRLFWLEAISDEYLEKIYAAATCLIFPSEGEGFGLPLIEAAQHGLPILARDLPVFREVAGERAAYFGGRGGDDLARAVLDWLKLHRQGRAPASDGLTYLTWEQSTERLLECLLPPATRH
jgi:glycosyltransferase involved in cell wall biosynthesis